MSCEHTNKILTLKTYSNGTTHLRHQCQDCFSAVGTQAVSKATFTSEELAEIPAFDEEKCEAAREKEREEFFAERREAMATAEQQAEERDSEWWEAYTTHLNSPAWREIRQKVLQRDGWKCQGCLVARATQVHHMSYKHVGAEFMFELVSLCKPCHDRWHRKGDE